MLVLNAFAMIPAAIIGDAQVCRQWWGVIGSNPAAVHALRARL
jgi:hypothetical protein